MQLVLKVVDALQTIHENRKEVISKIMDHPSKKDVTDCAYISDRVKIMVEEVKQQYEDFKSKMTKYKTSS